MKKQFITIFFFFLVTNLILGQQTQYTTQQIHSHNNYQQPIPLYDAINNKVGSLEIDILLWKDTLWVGHDIKDITKKNSLVSQYLTPLDSIIKKNHQFPYSNSTAPLQILIDIKTQADITLSKLIKELAPFKSLIDNPRINIVITGNQPKIQNWSQYPDYIHFDGLFNVQYDSYSLSRISLFSGDLAQFTKWNGKGILIKEDRMRIDSLVHAIHRLDRKIRFWNAPDNINSWIQLMKFEVDYLNSDKINEIATFLLNQKNNHAVTKETHDIITSKLSDNNENKKAKNVILIIGDGMGLAQIHSGYVTNQKKLNIYQIKDIGLSITHSADAFNSDSAPGATALSTGEKTNNRYVGVDTIGHPLQNITTLLQQKNKKIGIITSGDITDATPAAFYAHQTNRENSKAIFNELLASKIDFVAGSGEYSFDKKRYSNIHLSNQARFSIEKGRGNWLSQQLYSVLDTFKNSPKGFFVMLEGAQVDYGGHANSLQYITNEVNDLDETIGMALNFALKNKETLVIITSDHETGGLTLLDGNLSEGTIDGQFSTTDHTALPVLVFAYGPQSSRFRGVYQNTEIYHKMLEALAIPIKK